MNILIYDTETTNSTIWGSIIECGAVLCDSNLNEISNLDIRGRIPEGEVPSAKALLVNKTDINLLTKANLSHYQMLAQIEAYFSKCAPACFIGWHNTNFDRKMFHFNLFRSNRYPYITHSSPNEEHDGLHIAQGAYAVDQKILKTGLTEKGNISMKLELLAKEQGFSTEKQHTAHHDSITALKILKIIKKKQPNNWDNFLKTSSKAKVETILKSEGIYSIAENYKGNNSLFLCGTINPKYCMHPSYDKWGYVFDLRKNIDPLLDMNLDELKSDMKSSKPKYLRVIKTNKAPIILDKSYALKEKPYCDLEWGLIQERAKKIRNSEKLGLNIQNILRETAEEKNQNKSQEQILPEESLYGKFVSNKDSALFKDWHSASWKDKLKLLDKFTDPRCAWFGQKIIYQEAPETLPESIFKKVKREIARRILSQNKEKWQTVNMAYNEIDNLRDFASNKNDDDELRRLDEINDYVMSIQKKYENT